MRMMVCWIGHADLAAARGEPKAGLGPVGRALQDREFDEVLLLSNYKKEEGAAYRRWAKERTAARVTVRQVDLDDPTDFTGIYKHSAEALAVVSAEHRRKSELRLTLNLSPGTGMMTAAWVILGKTKYPAELILTSPERGVRTAAVPLDIAAEFVDLIPDLLRGPDSALEARSSGEGLGAAQFGDIVYQGKAMGGVIHRARRLGVRRVPVLIEGESGTGKELLARAIHRQGHQDGRPFIAVNCGALPKELMESLLFGHQKGAFTGATKDAPGYFREAQGGTLFLDEIGELPLEAQVKLLRALQERAVTPVGDSKAHPVDARLIAATNRNLAVECREGRFREDLFYRLAIAVLRLPPLRERGGDLVPLIGRLLDKANEAGAQEEPGYQRKTLSAGAKNLLLNHSWPGNVRELENTLMRATVWTDTPTIGVQDMRDAILGELTSSDPARLPAALGNGFDLDKTLANVSRDYVQRALKEADGNKTLAAELLGLKSRQTLNNRIKTLGLSS